MEYWKNILAFALGIGSIAVGVYLRRSSLTRWIAIPAMTLAFLTGGFMLYRSIQPEPFQAEAASSLLTGLVAYYTFDESSGNAADSSGNGYTLTNNNTVTYTAGKINNAADGGSSNSNKSLTNTTDLLSASFSMCTGINVTTAPGMDAAHTYMSAASNSSNVIYRFQYFDDAGTKKLRFARQKNGVGDEAATETVTLTPGTWYDVCGTYDGTTLRLYRDNTETATGSASGTGSTDRGAGIAFLAIKTTGGTPYSEQFSSGLVDEAGIWQKKLETSEISERHNGGAWISYPFAVAIFNFGLWNDF